MAQRYNELVNELRIFINKKDITISVKIADFLKIKLVFYRLDQKIA